MEHDLIVLGGGPAGVTAALRGRELGATVALVERSRLGGICTNDGCVPTRVLAKAARFMRDAAQFADYGILLEAPPAVDFRRVIARAQQVVYEVHEKKQLLAHLHDVGVTVRDNAGEAHFLDPHHLALDDGTLLTGKHFILCVGGAARRLNFPGSEYTLTHSDVWRLDKLPGRVAIVGGGATGCQLASIMAAFGAKVTLLDVAPRLLVTEDTLVAETMTAEFERHGIDIVTGIGGLRRIERTVLGDSLVYTKDDAEHSLSVDAVILAVGWPGNSSALNLAAAGVELAGTYIKVDERLQTTAPHIYAAGDITGRMMLVQSAGYQARIAVENALLGGARRAEHRLVPHGSFTDPEYAGVGLTEEQARQNHTLAVAVVPYADVDRAVIDGHTRGFCKLIVDRATQRVIGAHVVGEQAVEVVQMLATGMASRLTVSQLADLELAYPTFAAIVGLAARQLARELGIVQVAPEWRALAARRGMEWERREE